MSDCGDRGGRKGQAAAPKGGIMGRKDSRWRGGGWQSHRSSSSRGPRNGKRGERSQFADQDGAVAGDGEGVVVVVAAAVAAVIRGATSWWISSSIGRSFVSIGTVAVHVMRRRAFSRSPL